MPRTACSQGPGNGLCESSCSATRHELGFSNGAAPPLKRRMPPSESNNGQSISRRSTDHRHGRRNLTDTVHAIRTSPCRTHSQQLVHQFKSVTVSVSHACMHALYHLAPAPDPWNQMFRLRAPPLPAFWSDRCSSSANLTLLLWIL